MFRQAIFQKPRITAKRIEARFSIDVGLLTSLSTLTAERQNLLLAIALWKVAAFLDKFTVEHSLRTECKLTLNGSPQVQVDKADKADFGYGAIKMNLDTDLQWAFWDGVRAYEAKNHDFLQGQIGNPTGPDSPNKKHYDPRVWLGAAEDSFSTRLVQSFEDLNCIGRNKG